MFILLEINIKFINNKNFIERSLSKLFYLHITKWILNEIYFKS